MPTLETLTLLEWDEQDVVHALSLLGDDVRLGDMSQGTGIFIPELQSLAIQCEKRDNGCDEEFSHNTLLRLLDTMSVRPTPLRSFRLVWTSSLLPRMPDELVVGRLQVLADEGMDIYLGTEECSWI